ncbi:aminoglycoside 3-N-acetyltransferase [Microlunatus speluncae]|uniref:aminoglycoside 3-N-acetyltransferase n=1 Tax=Microlunatus speluncae TaxID=2594267 RepID=UPI0013759958|nr:aminoglycoside 3-N-acetyltransferase [Microlunatus speluncae]
MRLPSDYLDRPDFVPITRSRLAESLRGLGVRPGGVLMVHVRLSALGWMVGGIDAVVWALRDVVGSAGTIMAFTGWEDSPYHVGLWPERWQEAYRDQPPFDPAASAARREFGRFPERLRTWPGALRSSHPEVSFTAWGPAAAELITEPADGDPWGSDGPLGRLVASDGQVLMLGASLKRLTLCHHAEAIADVGGKRYHEYRMPVLRDGRTEWVDYRTLDTFYGALPYWDRIDPLIDSWAGHLAEQAVAAGATIAGAVDDCPLVLVDAPAAVRAVTAWLESRF